MNKRGFTLIEMTVAVTIFVIIISVATGIFIRSLRAQKAITVLMAINDNASQAVEQIARELRTAINFAPLSTSDNRGVTFINVDGEIVAYRWNNDPAALAIERRLGTEDFQPITSPDVRIKRMAFRVEPGGVSVAPRVTIVLSVGTDGSVTEIRDIETNIQTTISSRNIRIGQEI